MKDYLTAPATTADGLELARNLRAEDRAELEGLGHHPIALPYAIATSQVAVTFRDADGTLGGIAGIAADDQPGVGRIWLLCTPELPRRGLKFVREARRWLGTLDYRLLWNVADVRNEYHHKFLKLLGFKALRIVPVGPRNLPYIEIVKVCASPSLPQVQPPAEPLPPPQLPCP